MKVAIKLFLITSICGALLWGVNSFTAPIIQYNKDAAKSAAYKEIFESDEFEIKSFDEGTIQEMFTSFIDGKPVGYVFLGDKVNNFGNITAMVVMSPEGEIQRVKITNYNQTAGKDTVTGEAFLDKFKGSMDAVESVDTKVGATFAATTVRDIVIAASNTYKSEVLGEEIEVKVDAPKADFSKAENGTYVGEYQGFAGLIKVQVIVKDGVATSVKVIEHAESIPGATTTIPEAIVKANSVDVDTVAGNTVSSQAIIQAVNEAMLNKVSDSTEEEVEKEPEIVIEKLDIKDGTYTGEAQGFVGAVKVSVTVKDGILTEVKVTENSESIPGATTTIPEAMMKYNKIDVDTVAGNTVTSNAVIEAVKKAVTPKEEVKPVEPTTTYTDGTYEATAKGFAGDIKVAVTVTDGKLADVKVVSHSESIPGACTTIPEAMVKENKVDVDTVSGNTVSSNAIIEAVKAALASEPVKAETKGFVDGTYEATAKGFAGDIKVAVTVTDGKLADVKVVSHSESIPGACQTVPEAMVKENKIDVDTVSGNTVSSKAIIDAVHAALGL